MAKGLLRLTYNIYTIAAQTDTLEEEEDDDDKNKAIENILGANMGPVVLHESDTIKVQASAANRAHVTVTVMKLGRGTGL